jgi:hypothetical protein
MSSMSGQLSPICPNACKNRKQQKEGQACDATTMSSKLRVIAQADGTIIAPTQSESDHLCKFRGETRLRERGSTGTALPLRYVHHDDAPTIAKLEVWCYLLGDIRHVAVR